MEPKSAKYWTSIENVPVDRSLKPEDGWKLANRWLIDENRLGSQFGTVGYSHFEAGIGRHELHRHEHAEVVSYYLKGRARMIVGDEEFEVGPGDITFVPRGTPHAVVNLSETEPLELLFIYMGASSEAKTGYKLVKEEEQRRDRA